MPSNQHSEAEAATRVVEIQMRARTRYSGSNIDLWREAGYCKSWSERMRLLRKP